MNTMHIFKFGVTQINFLRCSLETSTRTAHKIPIQVLLQTTGEVEFRSVQIHSPKSLTQISHTFMILVDFLSRKSKCAGFSIGSALFLSHLSVMVTVLAAARAVWKNIALDIPILWGYLVIPWPLYKYILRLYN